MLDFRVRAWRVMRGSPTTVMDREASRMGMGWRRPCRSIDDGAVAVDWGQVYGVLGCVCVCVVG